MKITLCGSTSFFEHMRIVKTELETYGHSVYHPEEAEVFVNTISSPRDRRLQYIIIHFNKIKKSDCILVVNHEKKGTKDYIGGNTFLEMGVACAFSKKIYILNSVPKMEYTDEITGMRPIVLKGKLANLKS